MRLSVARRSPLLTLLDPEKKEEFIRKVSKNGKVRLLVEQDLSGLRAEK